ncbi:phage baseplate assembly protein V [Hoeflea marina]|uniref:Phage baseplate assembly protein V n=1 Tax=Hoeflea marina TaxID=274592 RepID=A0A317PDU9_9HYPH|nr:phage baseplate assembly protein V [Hoeflea marina]PWV97709.1 phage baseplate assembly protein V [Hoeflea marina]
MSRLVASEIRTLHRKIQRVERRVASAVLPGKVKPGSQNFEDRTVRLILGKTPDGEEVLSPPVRWQQPGAGTLKVHAPPADNEQMIMLSPSGTIGSGSVAHWSTYDDDHAPPSNKSTEAVIEFADGSRITLEKETTRVAARNVHVDAETVTLGGEGGKAVARVGDLVQVGAGSSAGQWPIITGSGVVSAT